MISSVRTDKKCFAFQTPSSQQSFFVRRPSARVPNNTVVRSYRLGARFFFQKQTERLLKEHDVRARGVSRLRIYARRRQTDPSGQQRAFRPAGPRRVLLRRHNTVVVVRMLDDNNRCHCASYALYACDDYMPARVSLRGRQSSRHEIEENKNN